MNILVGLLGLAVLGDWFYLRITHKLFEDKKGWWLKFGI